MIIACDHIADSIEHLFVLLQILYQLRVLFDLLAQNEFICLLDADLIHLNCVLDGHHSMVLFGLRDRALALVHLLEDLCLLSDLSNLLLPYLFLEVHR